MARSNNNNKLKAYVRFDGSGRVVSSSLIVQAFKPKVGNWKEIDAKECCNYTSTTTTTTTIVVNYLYRMGRSSCTTCVPSGNYFRANAVPLTVDKFYYDNLSGFVFEILEFMGTTTFPTQVDINIETIQNDCSSVICSPTTTTTTTPTP